jgi:hypothetical protein
MALPAVPCNQIFPWAGVIKNGIPDPRPSQSEVRLGLDKILLGRRNHAPNHSMASSIGRPETWETSRRSRKVP